jgi:hypothetical protein
MKVILTGVATLVMEYDHTLVVGVVFPHFNGTFAGVVLLAVWGTITCFVTVAGSASCGKAGGQRFGRYFRLPHCFQAHCAGDLASAGPWHSSRVPTAFPCPWPGGERLRCRVPWGTCT